MYKRPELNNQEIVIGHKGRYKIAFKEEEKSPSGANGIVYPAYSLKTQEKVAVKLFSPREEPDKKKGDRLYRLFKNDIKKIQSITHWNVIKILDWGETQFRQTKIPFIVLEFIPWSLRDRFKKNLGLLPKIFHCAQLSDAVAYINWRGRLIHRDIKPENILLTSNGLIKVTDLGIARLMPDFEKDMMAALSLYPESLGVEHPRHYFSPEQLKLARLQDEKKSEAELRRVDLSRSDIFQLGKVFHEIFTGENPIGVINIMDEMYKETPKHLRLVIHRMLAQSSDARPPLEHCSCVLYVTLGLYLQEMLKRGKRLTRTARKDIADYFESVDSLSMDREEAYSCQYLARSKGLRKLSQLGFVRVITSFDVSGSWSFFPEVEYKSSPDKKLTIALTSQGIDLRNMIMGNTDWKNFIDLYFKLCKVPTSRSLAYATRAFKKPPTEWRLLGEMDRDVPEYSLLISKKKHASYYIFPPFSVGKRWWTEIHGSANLTETGARDPRVLHWGTGYDVPWCVVEAQTRHDVLKEAKKKLLQDGIPNEEVERVVSNHEGLKPGRWLNVSRQRLLSYGFFDRLISDNEGRPIRLKVGDPEGPLPNFEFKKVEVLEIEKLPTEEGLIKFDDLIKSIFTAEEISPSLEATIEGLFIRPVVIEEKNFLPLFFGMVLSVCWSFECAIEFTNSIWKISVALEKNMNETLPNTC